MKLKKLTFIGATDVYLVGAFGLSNTSATFDDCEWSGQDTGKASVLIYTVVTKALTRKLICCHLYIGCTGTNIAS